MTRTHRARAVGALGAALLLALLAVAALLLAGALSDPGVAHRSTSHSSVTVAVGDSEHAAPSFHGLHQPPSTRARTVVFGLLAVAVALGAWAFRRVRVVRSGRPRTLRITGLPPGRAPPRLRIA
jgi:hypothetical protein